MANQKPRKSLAIVVGNGFVMDLANTLKIDQFINTSCSNLLNPIAMHTPDFTPLNQHQDYLEGKLWRQDLWPNLHKAYSDGITFWQIAESCSTTTMSSSKISSTFTVKKYDTIEIELRYYLYYLFIWYTARYKEFIILHSRLLETSFWGEFSVLLSRMQNFFAISYNYDTIFESTLFNSSLNAMGPSPELALKNCDEELYPGEFMCLKPHGSVSHACRIGETNAPWRGGLSIESTKVIESKNSRGFFKIGFPPPFCSCYLDILLPGSNLKTLEPANSTVHQAISHLGHGVERVLFLGFNGGHADLNETRQLIKSFPKLKSVAILLTDRDFNPPVGVKPAGIVEILSTDYDSIEAVFVKPNEKHRLIEWLNK
tara:strand:+ start:176 stop:1288 length:1113 start_codon:yes stop_codon:yes gene_type:complete